MAIENLNYITCGSLGPGKKITANEFSRLAVRNGIKIIITKESEIINEASSNKRDN